MPQAAPQGGGGGQQEGSMGLIWVIVGAFLLLWGAWYFGHGEIVKLFFHLKLAEISAIQFFANVLDDTKQLILTTDPRQISFSTMTHVASSVGHYMRIPVVIALVLMGITLYFKSATVGFKRTYNMKDLLRTETQIWPYEMPILNLDLVNTDIDKGLGGDDINTQFIHLQRVTAVEFIAAQDRADPRV